MVNAALSIGGLVGVALSGGFVYWQVGRYATPQVPVTLFDERREVFAYTAGLFIGIPLALFLLFFWVAINSGALLAAGLDLAIFATATEAAQWGLLKTRYFGATDSRPFYAVGLRAGIGGILALAVVAQYLGGPDLAWDGLTAVLLQSLALVALQVAGALLALPARRRGRSPAGGPIPAAFFTAGGLGLLGISSVSGPLGAIIGAGIAALVGAYLYRQRRDLILAKVRVSTTGAEPQPSTTPFGRTDR